MKLLLLALAAVLGNAQDSSPNAAQAQAVLSRARERVEKTLHNLPRYICNENIERQYLDPLKPISPEANSCPAFEGTLGPSLRLRATDRVRLEVAVADGSEIDSWPDATKFDTRGIDIVQSGPISSGAFGTNLVEVFENPAAKIDFTGIQTRDGRAIFTYRYAVPADASDYMVRLLDGARWRTAYSGTLEIAADTAELINLTIETGRLPPYSGMCRARTINAYHRVKVGDGDFLIPLTSAFQTIHLDGTATASTTTFSACHQYTVEATIHFDADPDAASPPPPPVKAEPPPLPASTRIRLHLDSPIDTATAAAGDIVWASIDSVAVKPNTRESRAIGMISGEGDRPAAPPPKIPAGTRIRGRIMHATHTMNGHRGFDIEVTFDALQTGDADPIPFAGVAIASKPRLHGVDLSLEATGTGGSFNIRTKRDKVVLPAGIRFEWKTLNPPKPG